MTQIIRDWIHLPDGVAETSLWAALHDAELKAIRSDLLARTVTLEFESPHLQEFHGLPEDYRWAFDFEGVKSFRLTVYEIWPGEFPDSPDLSREDRKLRIQEYQAKWREESVNWKALAEALREGEDDFYVMDAAYVEDEGFLTLKAEGYLENANYYRLFLRTETLSVRGSDGAILTLLQFLQMGEAYWSAFANKPVE